MGRGWLYDLCLAAVLAVLYFATAVFGLSVNAVSGFATLVWIPSGLSLVFLYKFGLRFWPAVMVGAFLANYATGAPILAALGIGIGNSLEAIVGVYLLKRVAKIRPQLDRVNDVLAIIVLAAFVSTIVSATVGVTSLLLTGVIELSSYCATWLAWWSGDSVSDLVIAPLLLVWSYKLSSTAVRRTFYELAALITAACVITLIVFGGIGITLVLQRPSTYMIFPVLIWAALRFNQRETTLAIFLVSAIATWQTANNHGQFITQSPGDNLVNLQLYTAVVASTALILAAAMAERRIQERKKDEFISVASHELKTPITSIKTFTQALQLSFERKGDKQSSGYLSQMNRQVDRLNRLVIKLLDIGRIQEGRISLQKEKFNIGKLIREIVEEISETTHHKIEIKGSISTNIFADRDRIGRVLTNLLSNAATYSPKADIIIVRVTKSATELVLSVQDFGPGISKTEQSKIFDRFYQAENSRSKDNATAGLGLYISRGIIELHGGKIWVESQKNSNTNPGSTFYFSLPRQG